MPYLITEKCDACGDCAPECPVECIAEGSPKYVINQEECTDCGACAEVCPNDAITEVD